MPTQIIRSWARQNGHAVSTYGRISRGLRDAYIQAHAETIETTYGGTITLDVTGRYTVTAYDGAQMRTDDRDHAVRRLRSFERWAVEDGVTA